MSQPRAGTQDEKLSDDWHSGQDRGWVCDFVSINERRTQKQAKIENRNVGKNGPPKSAEWGRTTSAK